VELWTGPDREEGVEMRKTFPFGSRARVAALLGCVLVAGVVVAA
jgi:hypothetical protein